MTQRSLIEPSIVSQMTVDSSLKGWGAVVISATPQNIASGTWSTKDKSHPIVILEAKAMYMGAKSFPWVVNQHVAIFSDCKAAVGALNKGGSPKSQHLQYQIVKILELAKAKSITVSGHYIKGQRNILADQLSRKHQNLPGEWSLTTKAFEWICKLTFVPQVDLFSTDWNHKVPEYCTLYKSKQTPYMDAMSIDWNKWDKIYLFPPPILLLKVLQKLQLHTGTALLVFPDWPNRPWYQLIQQRATTILSIPFKDLWQGHPGCPTFNSPECWRHVNFATFIHSSYKFRCLSLKYVLLKGKFM